MQSVLWLLCSLSFADDYSILEEYLEKRDKPNPETEIFNIKNINYKSNSGYVCTYKEQLEDVYDSFFAQLKRQRKQYERCNFSAYLVYLFDEKEFHDGIRTVIKMYDFDELSMHNYLIRDTRNPTEMSIAFICKNCSNSRTMIKENIDHFFRNTCIKDRPDGYSKEQVEYLKKRTNEVSRKDRK